MKSNNELVLEIHEAFYSAEERLLQEAKDLLSNPRLDKALYAERLNKLGFGVAKPVKEAIDMAEAHQRAGNTISSIEYWRIHYPNNKFITEAEVKKICEKYGLLLGDAANYTGDIPEKNLVEIEKFNLRKEDWTEKPLAYGFSSFFFDETGVNWFGNGSAGPYGSKVRRTEALSSYFERVNLGIGNSGSIGASIGMLPLINGLYPVPPSYQIGYDPYSKPTSPAKETEQAAFKICAPKQDFNTSGFVVMDGFRLVYDPVVLQPVKNGFLIVTAWGIEATDELVINHNQN